MKERKQLKKKESKWRYVVLIIAVVFLVGAIAYNELDIDLKDIDLFKKDKVVNEEITNGVSNVTDVISLSSTINNFGETTAGLLILVGAICLFGLAIVVFILPIFKNLGGLEGI